MSDFSMDDYTFVPKKEYNELRATEFALVGLFGYLKYQKKYNDNITVQEVLDMINEQLEKRGIDRLN